MASMPDLIFTVLFFFMIVTHMRTETPRLKVETPDGTELTKPENKRYVANLYIGTDKNGESRIQIADKVVQLEEVGPMMTALQNRMEEGSMIVNIRADKKTAMGLVTDVKQELRKYGLLNIRYNATEQSHKANGSKN